MDVIDVTVVGGPDVAAEVRRSAADGGTRLDVTLRCGSEVPARLERVAIVVESPPIGAAVALGWDAPDAGAERSGPGIGLVGAPGVVTDRGAIGWLGATAHRGEVALQADGWLVTAWAGLAGLILAPGEAMRLDPLWIGTGTGTEAAADAWAAAWAAEVGPLRDLPPEVEIGVGGAVEAPLAAVDLTSPGTPARLREAGAALLAAGATWVAVTGAAGAVAPGPRWGGASTTPVAALRAALAALRDGLGPGPVLHLAGGPPAAGAGAVDVVDTGPGWPAPDPLTAPRRRAWLHGRAWWACPGPLGPGVPAPVVSELATLGGTLVRWPAGPPAHAAG